MSPPREDWLVQTGNLIAAELPRLGIVGVAFVLITIVEWRWPAERGQRLGGRLRNLVHAAIFVVLGMAALSFVLNWWAVPGARGPDAGLGASLLSCVACMFAIDFFYYWYHRAQHTFPALWAVHELHHTDAQLNITTSMRTYWLETPVQMLLCLTPALWLVRMDATALALLPAFTTGFLLFTHSNVRVRLGALTPILCGPQVHRIHHSIEPRHRDRNFAQFFPVFDVLFGTYCAPRRNEVPRTGTEDMRSDAPHATMLVRPFWIWVRKLGAWLRRKRPTSG